MSTYQTGAGPPSGCPANKYGFGMLHSKSVVYRTLHQEIRSVLGFRCPQISKVNSTSPFESATLTSPEMSPGFANNLQQIALMSALQSEDGRKSLNKVICRRLFGTPSVRRLSCAPSRFRKRQSTLPSRGLLSPTFPLQRGCLSAALGKSNHGDSHRRAMMEL